MKYTILRIWTRGIKNANKFMLGAAIAYNLKKYLNFIAKKSKTKLIALPAVKVNSNKGITTLFFAF